MQNYLANANASRTFFTQSLLTQDTNFDKEEKQKKNKKVYDRDLVRTDSKSQSIDVFLTKPSNNAAISNNSNVNNNISSISSSKPDLNSLKSKFTSHLDTNNTTPSSIEIFEINKSNYSDSSSKNQINVINDDNNTSFNKSFSSDENNILSLNSDTPSHNKLKSLISNRMEQDDIIIEKPTNSKNNFSNIEIFDNSKIENSLKRINDSSSNSDYSSYESRKFINKNSNKKIKYNEDQEEITTIKNPVYISKI